jgi:hypothetical protein
MNCAICTEKFNKSNHSVITCPVCQVQTCSTCTEKYLLMTTENAHCMTCRAAWTRETLDTCGLSKKFVTKDYKERREDVLFERERGLMPATQPYVEKEIVIRRLKREVNELEAKVYQGKVQYSRDISVQLQDIADDLHSESVIECTLERIERAYNNYRQCTIYTNEINKKNVQIRHLYNIQVDSRREARKFVRACPQNDCKGFLSTAWKCGLCERRACPECHDPKEDDHVCKQESLETARLLARDTRTCPKCAAQIFKIDGCDQMWCTQCATAFSWRTGKIEVGRIHNPHYYDYQRNVGRAPREIGDIPCGGLPSEGTLVSVARNLLVMYTIPLTIHRMHTHIEFVLMPTWQPRWTDNQDLRIEFMLNTIPEAVFKKKIQQREKENQKNTELVNIMNTYQVVTAEIMQRLVDSKTGDEFNEITKEFFMIKDYTNDLLSKVSRRYSVTTPFIQDDFRLSRKKE